MSTRTAFHRARQYSRRRRLVTQAASGMTKHLGLILTHAYMGWLGLSMPARELVTSSSSVALVLAAILFLLEVVAAIFQKHIINFHFPWWIQGLIVLLAFVMLRHRYHELKSLQRKPIFTSKMNALLRDVTSMEFQTGTTADKDQRLDQFITSLLTAFRTVFEDTGTVQLNVMLPGPDGLLRIRYQHPPGIRYNPRLTFKRGEGGSGVAFETDSIVYIPRIGFRHGILVSMSPDAWRSRPDITYTLAESVYVPTRPEPYKAVLCVPIRTEVGVVGVLNLDIGRSNPFTDSDFQTAEVAAGFLGMAIERRRLER